MFLACVYTRFDTHILNPSTQVMTDVINGHTLRKKKKKYKRHKDALKTNLQGLQISLANHYRYNHRHYQDILEESLIFHHHEE